MIVYNVLADDLAEKFMFDDEEVAPKVVKLMQNFVSELYLQSAKEFGELDDYLDEPFQKNKFATRQKGLTL